jgi:hypothetical protein
MPLSIQNPIHALISSAKKAWRGEEALWKVFWLWGVLIYSAAVPIGMFAIALEMTLPAYPQDFLFRVPIHLFAVIIGLAGLIFVFLYPVIFSFSLWRCSKNTRINILCILMKAFVPIFCLIHIPMGSLCLMGSLSLFNLVIKLALQ